MMNRIIPTVAMIPSSSSSGSSSGSGSSYSGSNDNKYNTISKQYNITLQVLLQLPTTSTPT